MWRMKQPVRTLLALAIFAPLCAQITSEQTQGSIAFTARLTPSSGIAEPVRGLPFYLLRKSFAAIEKDATAAQPAPDMDKFIDALTVSKQLKDWMKKHHTVRISGDEFASNLTAQEILTVPEFWKAYDELNISNSKFGYPVAKYNDRERERKPTKYQHDVDEFHSRILKYIADHPDSKEGMDAELESIDPNPRWMDMVTARRAAARNLVLDLAQSRYLAAQTQSDANGQGEFSNLAPGNYWLTSLNIDGQVGDTRATWDVPVTVRAGAATQILLSNYNSVPAEKPAP